MVNRAPTFFAAVVTALVVSAAFTDPQPVFHWTLDEGTGPAAMDEAANRRAQIVGATSVEGLAGKALQFDGKDDYVGLGDLGTFPAVTIAFWMRCEDASRSDNWQALVSSDAWEEGVFHLPVRYGGIDLYLHMGGAQRRRLRSPRLRSDTWYHVAVTADRGAGFARLYLNGEQVDAADISSLTTDLKLLRQVIGRESEGRYLDGAIDDVRFYDTALDGEQVRALCPQAQPPRRDLRNIRTGYQIPDEGYCDQPYVVVTKDGNWLCLVTTGTGHEGDPGQHVISTISEDKGRTWSKPVPLETADGPESAYSAPLITPFGRVYAFYGYNGDNLRSLEGWNGKFRGDMLGWCVTRWSDDGGRTWSDRHRLPMRVTACDRGNNWHGKHQIWWTIDKPIVQDDEAYFALTKLGRYMLELGEGWVYHSDNLLHERDYAKVRWELLPDGEHGLRAPAFGSVQEEHNVVPLNDGSLYCVYRTTTGYPCHSYSRYDARLWTTPKHMTYTPSGRRIKNPRACPKVWKTTNGRYLFWFHNHSGKSFDGRNPAWIVGGIEKHGFIHWSQPEILLYDPDPNVRMSYPDLIEQDGRYWVTETQKTIARVHEIDATLLDGLWSQGEAREVARDGLVLELVDLAGAQHKASLPGSLDLSELNGLTLDVWVESDDSVPGQALLDSRDDAGRGIALTTTDSGGVRIKLSDGEVLARWDSDAGLLQPGQPHHVVAIVDAGPQIITFVVDGVLCDGGEVRQYGWGRYPEPFGDVSGTGVLQVAPSVQGLRVYDRYLRTSEAVANFRAGTTEGRAERVRWRSGRAESPSLPGRASYTAAARGTPWQGRRLCPTSPPVAPQVTARRRQASPPTAQAANASPQGCVPSRCLGRWAR